MVSLCQQADASCGACCGIYNRDDLSREAVRRDLRRNTEIAARTPRTPEAFRGAAAARARELPAPLFPSVRVCPLAGFINRDEARVGCLAHPQVTGGVDLRACGVYDALTCDAFLCPSHALLGEEDAGLAALAAGDFYLYGLVVTDAPFLHAVLEGLAELAGRRPVPSDLDQAPFRRALHALLALKEDLGAGSEGLFGAFRPARGGEPTPAGAAGGSPAERILEALGADPRSGNDGEELAVEVERRLGAAVAALARAGPGWPRAQATRAD